jgi:hypothetical protein
LVSGSGGRCDLHGPVLSAVVWRVGQVTFAVFDLQGLEPASARVISEAELAARASVFAVRVGTRAAS